MSTLEQNIESMKRQLAEMEARLKVTKKWEPQSGRYTITATGDVLENSMTSPKLPSNDTNEFGMQFQTRMQAEIVRDLMRKRNRTIQYALEQVPHWNFEFVPSQNNYTVGYGYASRTYTIEASTLFDSAKIYMPEHVARQLANDINIGRVEL